VKGAGGISGSLPLWKRGPGGFIEPVIFEGRQNKSLKYLSYRPITGLNAGRKRLSEISLKNN
ncbi:MAG: hypothetical protein WBG37_11340, partial [Desulfobacterales bacterium]